MKKLLSGNQTSPDTGTDSKGKRTVIKENRSPTSPESCIFCLPHERPSVEHSSMHRGGGHVIHMLTIVVTFCLTCIEVYCIELCVFFGDYGSRANPLDQPI